MIIFDIIDQMTTKWLSSKRRDYVYGEGEYISTWQNNALLETLI